MTEVIRYLAPFTEDIRTLSFPSLEVIRNIKGRILKEHRFLPTEQMRNDMREYVNFMDMTKMDGDEQEE